MWRPTAGLENVTPAKAGVQGGKADVSANLSPVALDSGVRRNDAK